MLLKSMSGLLLAAGLAAGAHAQTSAICYSCPEEWADWGSQLREVKQATGVSVPFDSKNSGQALAQMVAEKAHPVADFSDLGITFGIQAQQLGLTQPYKPPHFDEIPATLKDPDGNWFAIHTGAVGFFVNKDALGNLPVPRSWKDLLKPEYKGLVGYYDPTSAFIGYIAAMAANVSLGGTLDNFAPGISYFQALKKNAPIVVNQTAYARVMSGEIAILVDSDFNANRGRYKDKANVEFVMPAEGSLAVPYVMVLARNAPHPEAAKKVLDFLLSDKGQTIWSNAFLRPVRNVLPKETMARLFPEKDYARVKAVDFRQVAQAQKKFADLYLAEVR